MSGREERCCNVSLLPLHFPQMDYFGLQFQSKHGHTLRWVEREAVLKKHLVKFGRVPPAKPEADLTFGVQYFTNTIGALSDEIARYSFTLGVIQSD